MLTAFSVTDIGKNRQLNQDYVFASTDSVGNLTNMFIVADGMGGHAAGDYASRTAVDVMVESVSESFERNPVKILTKALDAANTVVYTRAKEYKPYDGMGTTVVACSFVGRYLQAINVGDSRLYIIRNQGIRQVSVDHSLVEEMVRSGGIGREQARNHPDKNIITRAVGVKSSVNPDVFTEELRAGDVVLLCSDGLTNMLDDNEIHRIVVNSDSLEAAATRLVDAANENGGKDNISVVLVRYED